MYQKDINGRIQLGEKKNRKKKNSDGRNANGSKDGNQDREQEIKGMEEIMELVVRLEEERWKIIGVYVKGNLNRKGPRGISM